MAASSERSSGRRGPDGRSGASTRATVDLAVVGAGPAGAAAAITAARHGLDVVVIDKARFPREKCCGDGLTTLALRLLEGLGYEPSSTPSFTTVTSAWVRSPSGRVIELPFPHGRGLFGAVVPRIELDAALVELTRKSGAEVHEGAALRAVRLLGDAVELELEVEGSAAPIVARYVIGADGMWSPLRRMTGLATDGYRGEWHAVRQYATAVTGLARTQMWVWFDRDLLPGYAWSFPLPDGRVNLGFGLLRDGARPVGADIATIWAGLLDRSHVRDALGDAAVLEGRHLAWPIPARIDRAVFGAGRVLFAGDAIGATDVLTGEGIGQALLTGIAAADAVHATSSTSESPGDVQARYRRTLRRALVADHVMSAALGRILATERGARGAVRIAGLSDWTRRNFARWLFEDEPRAVVLTPRRWHRQFLDRDGAYAGQ